MTEQESKTIQTYDETAHAWSAQHAVTNDWLQTAIDFHGYLPGGRILEVGCGGGRDAAALIGLGYDYLGTDASSGMVDVARREVPEARFEVCSVYDVARYGTDFDGFWACAVLLHMPRNRIDEALQAILTTQRSKAIGMISIKDGSTDDFEVRDHDGMHEERLFVYWQKPDFDAVLARNGLSVVNYEYRPVSQRTNWHVYFVQKD